MPRFVADITVSYVFEARSEEDAVAMAQSQLEESLAGSWLAPNPATWTTVEAYDAV